MRDVETHCMPSQFFGVGLSTTLPRFQPLAGCEYLECYFRNFDGYAKLRVKKAWCDRVGVVGGDTLRGRGQAPKASLTEIGA